MNDYRALIVIISQAASWLRYFLLMMWMSLACNSPASQPIKLVLGHMERNGAPRLHVSGSPGETLRLEASPNLRDWYPAATIQLTNNSLDFSPTNSLGWRQMFYRVAKPSSAKSPLRVVPEVDPLLSTSALVTPQAGGQCSLTNAGGIEFTFTVASNQVLKSVPVTMKVITNYTSFPASGGLTAAVVFEPDGYQFAGAGLLEIRFPTNVPYLRLMSYTFASDGSNFHFVPDRVAPNSVRIPITHFSAAGVDTWTSEQRANIALEAIGLMTSAISDRVARELGRVRLAREAGQVSEEELGQRANQIIFQGWDEVYEQTIEPYLEEARRNCKLGLKVVQQAIIWEKPKQMLGAGEGEGTPLFASLLPGVLCHCAEEAIARCEQGTATGEETMNELLKLDNYLFPGSALLKDCPALGGKSVTEALAESPCAGEWTGTLTGTETGTHVFQGKSDSGEEKETNERYHSSFSASVVGSELVDFWPGIDPGRWLITLKGTFDRSVMITQNTAWQVDCVTDTIHYSSQGYGTDEVTFTIEMRPPLKTTQELIISSDCPQIIKGSGMKFETIKNPCIKPPLNSGRLSAEMIDFPIGSPLSHEFPDFKFTILSDTHIEAEAKGTQRGAGMDAADIDYDLKLTLVRKVAVKPQP